MTTTLDQARQQFWLLAERLKRHPNQGAVRRLLKAMADVVDVRRELLAVEPGMTSKPVAETTAQLKKLKRAALNARNRMEAAAKELDGDF